MTKKKGLAITLLGLFFVINALVFSFAILKTRTMVEEQYFETTSKNIDVVDGYINMFFNLYRSQITKLALASELVTAHKDFPMTKMEEDLHLWSYEDLPEAGKRIIESWRDLLIKDTNISDIYVGYESGESISYEGNQFPAGFAGSSRPWYRAAKAHDEDVHIGSAYLALSGETVTPVTHKIYDFAGDFIGIIGLDIALSTLMNYLEQVDFIDINYFLLVEKSGRILCDTKYISNNFRFINELSEDALQEMYNSEKANHVITLNNEKTYFIVKRPVEYGYTLISVVAKEEILLEAYKSLKKFLIVFSLVLAFIFLSLYYFRRFFLSSFFKEKSKNMR